MIQTISRPEQKPLSAWTLVTWSHQRRSPKTTDDFRPVYCDCKEESVRFIIAGTLHQFTHSSCITCQEITHLAQYQQNLQILKPRMKQNLIKSCKRALSIHLSPFCTHLYSIISLMASWCERFLQCKTINRTLLWQEEFLVMWWMYATITWETYFYNYNVFKSLWYTSFSFPAVAAKHFHAFWHMLESHVWKCCRNES